MADIFVVNYLLQTLSKEGGGGDWSAFRGKQIEGIDLSRADLENRCLKGYDLAKVNLSAGRFYNADLSGAKLNGANLAHADMRRAKLWHADLSGTDLSGAVLDSVSAVGADFENARMRGCKLSAAVLVGARFVRTVLQDANFRGADLKGADLTGADLGQADFEGADLTECRLDAEVRLRLRSSERPASGKRPSQSRSDRASRGGREAISKEDSCRILGVSPGASVEQIARAYRARVMQCHPDKVRHLGEERQRQAHGEFVLVQKAYHSLMRSRAKPLLEEPDFFSGAPRKSQEEFSLYDLLQLTQANPNNDRVFYNLGLKYFDEGMLDRAIEAYERALQLNPKNRFAQHNLKIARLSLTLGAEGRAG